MIDKSSVVSVVSPKRGLMRFGHSDKLSPRFIGSFKVLNRIGAVIYVLPCYRAWPIVHNVFYIFMLRKYEPTLHMFWIGEIFSSTRMSSS